MIGEKSLSGKNILEILQVITTVFLGVIAYENGKIANDINFDLQKRERIKQKGKLELILVKFIHNQKNIRILCESIENAAITTAEQIEKLDNMSGLKLANETKNIVNNFIEAKYIHLSKLEYISNEARLIISELSEITILALNAKIYSALYLQLNNLEISKQNMLDIIRKASSNNDLLEKEINSKTSKSVGIDLNKLFDNTVQLDLKYVLRLINIFEPYALETQVLEYIKLNYQYEEITIVDELMEMIKAQTVCDDSNESE
jgi:hypothetical protein